MQKFQQSSSIQNILYVIIIHIHFNNLKANQGHRTESNFLTIENDCSAPCVKPANHIISCQLTCYSHILEEVKISKQMKKLSFF